MLGSKSILRWNITYPCAKWVAYGAIFIARKVKDDIDDTLACISAVVVMKAEGTSAESDLKVELCLSLVTSDAHSVGGVLGPKHS